MAPTNLNQAASSDSDHDLVIKVVSLTLIVPYLLVSVFCIHNVYAYLIKRKLYKVPSVLVFYILASIAILARISSFSLLLVEQYTPASGVLIQMIFC